MLEGVHAGLLEAEPSSMTARDAAAGTGSSAQPVILRNTARSFRARLTAVILLTDGESLYVPRLSPTVEWIA